MKLGQLCWSTSTREEGYIAEWKGNLQRRSGQILHHSSLAVLGPKQGRSKNSSTDSSYTEPVQYVLGVLEDYFLALMADSEEKDFNYYPPGNWGGENSSRNSASMESEWETGRQERIWEELVFGFLWASFLSPRTTMWFFPPKLLEI